MDKESQRRGPSKNVLIQQTIPVRQLVFTTGCVLGTLLIMSLICFGIGAACFVFVGRVQEFSFVYSDPSQPQKCLDVDQTPCLVQFNLSSKMEGPVYFYYTLTNFYQNHRRYVPSRSDIMNRGDFGKETVGDSPTGTTTCTPWDTYKSESGQDIAFYPCGLVAKSIFNDSFRLSDSNSEIQWSNSGIAWPNADGKTYVSKDENWIRSYCYKLGSLNANSADFEYTGFTESLRDFKGAPNGRYHCWRNLSSPEVGVWMRTSAASAFWKLHRVASKDLEKGSYKLEIQLNFPVSNFSGTKGFVLTNASPFGGRRDALAIVFLCVGAMSMVFFIALSVLALIKKRGEKPLIEYVEVNATEPAKSVSKPAGAFSRLKPGASTITGQSGEIAQRIIKYPPAPDQKFASNFVSTTKYTMLTFVPLNLMLQFNRFANCYFLVVAILASIASISPVGGSTFWLPLLTVLFITALKDGLEDYGRYKSDVEENGRITEIWNASSGKFDRVPWAAVTVGSLVRVTAQDDGCSSMIPSDLVLLATSSLDGTCFLETMNLDGETNLKQRQASEDSHKDLSREDGIDQQTGEKMLAIREDALKSLKMEASCAEPDAQLYDFNGRMKYNQVENKIPLYGGSSGGQFLQRSTKLKNTKWVVGICVYTGKETKIQKNMSDPPNKVSNIERKLNTFIIALFSFLFCLCCTGAIGAGIYVGKDDIKGAWYLQPSYSSATFNVGNSALSGILSFFSFLILLSMLIPISLYVSVEFVKAFIAHIISSDRLMYVEEDDMPSKARSAGLCEELGQVNYIFSDKTGTLTQNLMEFKKCSIGGVEYGRGYCEVERAIARRKGQTLPPDPDPPPGLDPGFRFVDERLLFGQWRAEREAETIEMFCRSLAINHGVQVEADPLRPDAVPVFQAESPDEGAFVSAARNLGFYFCRRSMKDVVVRIDTPQGREDATWTVLNSNAFDNNRKRTSVVVRKAGAAQGGWGGATLLVKGADTCVMPFVDASPGACPFFDETQRHLDKFSEQGLRTLVFAGRELTRAEYEAWNADYEAACLLSEGREDELRKLASFIEENHLERGRTSVIFDSSTPHKRSLKLYGVTALEDKLQENVGHCIAQLAKAMIKIWVLTGDKLETAINIGYATALLNTEMEPLIRISQDELADPAGDWEASATGEERALHYASRAARDKDSAGLRKHLQTLVGLSLPPGDANMVKDLLDKVNSAFSAGTSRADMREEDINLLSMADSKLKDGLLRERVRKAVQRMAEQTSRPRAGGYALVIDGPCLRAAMEEDLKHRFLKASILCKAVVCCRVTPAQKAQVTLLVKDNMPGQITLAIGDGANDVSMIQAAHIGVGIRGKEGQQAVLASDYALPRFAYLERLLLIHGRWSYSRIGTMVCYFFYKNISYALTLFWFAISNAFSAQALYDDGYQSLYNLMFTSLPVMFFAVLDRDLEGEIVCLRPELYYSGQINQHFNSVRFGSFIIGAVLHSLLLFYVTFYSMDLNVTDASGRGYGVWSVGTVVLTNVIITVTVIISLHTRSWTWLHMLVYVGSVLLWFLFLLTYHSLTPGWMGSYDAADNVFGVIFQIGNSLLYWLVQLAVVLLCVVPVLSYKYFREHYTPGIDDYYRRVVANPDAYKEKEPELCAYLTSGGPPPGAGHAQTNGVHAPRPASVPVPTPRDAVLRNGADLPAASAAAGRRGPYSSDDAAAAAPTAPAPQKKKSSGGGAARRSGDAAGGDAAGGGLALEDVGSDGGQASARQASGKTKSKRPT